MAAEWLSAWRVLRVAAEWLSAPASGRPAQHWSISISTFGHEEMFPTAFAEFNPVLLAAVS